MQLKRPILVGGLGLSASLWLMNVVGHSPLGDGSGVLGLVAVGSGLWWLTQRRGSASIELEPPLAIGPVDKAAVEAVVKKIETCLDDLIAELPEDTSADAPIHSQIAEKRAAIASLVQSLDRESLSLAVVGNKAVGKTALIEKLNADWQFDSSKSEQSNIAEVVEINGEGALPPTDADLVLFVTAADLTNSELKRLQTLLKAGYRTQIVFNKQDQLAPLDRQSVIQRVQTRVEDLGIGVSAIAANPNPITVRRHQENGEIEEFTEQSEPQLTALTDTLTHLTTQEAPQLVMTTTLRQAKALLLETQQMLNAQRREQAMPIVENMQWIAAGSAFASPLPSLDLLASTAINAQMIVDLGAVYGQSFSMEQAKAAASTLAELLVKLGLVELSTQALGSLLKTHAATYVAGGALQGVSAAYLTRMVGISLIDFFAEQSLLAPEQRKFAFADMGDRLEVLFQAAKQTSALKGFVDQAINHLPQLPQSKTAAAQ
ncbi:MAG: DUF697 domain-containing protein [Cyanobacteria bacterium P01_D01_bin.105]